MKIKDKHKLFADALFETIFKGADMCKSKNSETAMYQNEGTEKCLKTLR